MGLKKGQAHSGQFKPGNKFGKGGKRLPKEIKELRKESYERLMETIARAENLTADNVAQIDQSTLTLSQRFILQAYIKQDFKIIQYLQDRFYGRPVESHRLVDEDGNDRELIISNDFLPVNKVQSES